ncbi:ATP-binding Cassette (ABC) Superfamily [Phytophthora nicotianae]|uniref:ATP-binding Cassette (ABC) Superfamily n=1 Tax=Phytophthora nicotianae TaxID=4792 RepID=A0A0W8D3S4_PHYNI|nr:ATP-binding Cassette (ABC) Superfamily [Phytophthora nicotianae]
MRQLARDFGVDEKSIRRIINAAADIEARASSSAVLNMRAHVHRRPAPRFPELEKTLAAWIDARERAKAEISPSIIIDKAKMVARSMGISPDQFKASWGWYDKFSKRYGVRTAYVGSAEVTRDDYKIRETNSLQDLHKLMTQYDPNGSSQLKRPHCSTILYLLMQYTNTGIESRWFCAAILLEN